MNVARTRAKDNDNMIGCTVIVSVSTSYSRHCFITLFSWLYDSLLWTWDLRVGQKKEPWIGFIQENSIENSIQDYLPYILIPNDLCELFLAYPKWPYVFLKGNVHIIYCMTSSLPECFTSFSVSCDLWLYHLMWPAMWQHDLVSLTLTLVLKIE